MKKLLMAALPLLCIFVSRLSTAQTLKFNKAKLTVKEPYVEGKDKTDTILIELKTEGLNKTMHLKADPIQTGKGSSYAAGKFRILPSSAKIDSLKEKNTIELEITSDVFSDADRFIIINVNYEDLKDTSHTKQQVSDTLFVTNTYPFTATAPKEYNSKWNDGKRAEIFIGTNFDFYGDNTLTDWYGGATVFLPGITDFKYHKGKTNDDARWGIHAGLYHSKSFSNFGNTSEDEYDNISRKIIRRYQDTVNNVPVPAIDFQQDSIKIKTKTEINNWAAYGGVMFQLSRYENQSEDFVTNIFVGAHAEVIRRSVSTSYIFDTLGTVIRTTYNPTATFPNRMPRPNKETYYDGYFGINTPLQFLWKDIIDLKIIPCFGLGSASSFSSPGNSMPGFYLFNFDLLARLGGLRLNLGGEIRGYFQQAPILSAYLGSSFSVSKLVDFVTK